MSPTMRRSVAGRRCPHRTANEQQPPACGPRAQSIHPSLRPIDALAPRPPSLLVHGSFMHVCIYRRTSSDQTAAWQALLTSEGSMAGAATIRRRHDWHWHHQTAAS